MVTANRPSALISYSHDSPQHERRVLALCNKLRANGVDAFADQFLAGAPSEGWPLWMERQIESRDFTLMVFTEGYRRRLMEEKAPSVGRGVVWEAPTLRNLLYNDLDDRHRIIPVVLGERDRAFVPAIFKGHVYDAADPRGFDELVRNLGASPATQGQAEPALQSFSPELAHWSAFEQPWLIADGTGTRYFTGRVDLLDLLGQQIFERGRAALCGRDGAGKTQTAIAYATRHRKRYGGGVFFVNAENISSTKSGFVEIAKALRMTAAALLDQEKALKATIDWFNENERWLLVFDNVDDRGMVKPFLPERGAGHVLIASREPVLEELGIARALEVEDFDAAEALSFLFERTGRDQTDPSERSTAAALAEELGNFPLALEQAGAYIRETNAAFSDYLATLRGRRIGLPERARTLFARDSVARTSLSNFAAVEAVSPAAADVLLASAFFAADDIPFELLVDLSSDRADSAVIQLLQPPAHYSLIRASSDSSTYSIHPLVQEMIRAALSEGETQAQIERAVRALSAAFPESGYVNWSRCDRLVPHALSIATWLERYDVRSEQGAALLSTVASYLNERGRCHEALPLGERSLAIRERVFGPHHPLVAESLNDVAASYWGMGRFSDAQALALRGLEIKEAAFGKDDPKVADSLDSVAEYYRSQGVYAQALAHCERELAIREKALGPDDPNLAVSLSNVAALYHKQARYSEARTFWERALGIQERARGKDHPAVARILDALAELNKELGKFSEAHSAVERALEIRERTLGSDHLDLAYSLNTIAEVYRAEGRPAEAQAHFERALALRRRILGNDHPEVAASLDNLAGVYGDQGRYAEAEPPCVLALEIRERQFGSDHPELARSLANLGRLFRSQGRPKDAVRLIERALSIRERSLGNAHPEVAENLESLALLYVDLGRQEEARVLLQRVLEVRERCFGQAHPNVERTRTQLAGLGE